MLVIRLMIVLSGAMVHKIGGLPTLTVSSPLEYLLYLLANTRASDDNIHQDI